MKKFDLEAAKNGAKVVTRNGYPVRIVCYDFSSSDGSIIALINKNGEEFIKPIYQDGSFSECNRPHSNDLFMATETKSGWINIYGGKLSSKIYKTKEFAEHNAGFGLIDTIKIEWEE